MGVVAASCAAPAGPTAAAPSPPPGDAAPAVAAPLERAYESETLGLALRYPAGWRIVEARACPETEAHRAAECLLEGEEAKVTLVEDSPAAPPGAEIPPWPGEFEAVRRANVEGLTAAARVDRLDPEDVVSRSDTEVAVDGDSAVLLRLFAYDHTAIEVHAVRGATAWRFGFAGENPNDPDAAGHEATYRAILGTVRLTNRR